ncbi:hypothetical protein F8O08_03470 [Pseudoclavibacter sp. CFCC 13611]|nr:hypothetical protein F8O08_03470 [Pseudoclavibacter sp. CFCC 13611]
MRLCRPSGLSQRRSEELNQELNQELSQVLSQELSLVMSHCRRMPCRQHIPATAAVVRAAVRPCL